MKKDEFGKNISKIYYEFLKKNGGERLVTYASKKMGKRLFSEFFSAAEGVEEAYVNTLTGDVSWFCKKFDYRYDEEPWYNSKDSVPRAIRFLTGSEEDEE